ncbi:MAG: sodium-dependent bicarbonate transport family permease [Pseudomonadota bacterium]
MDAAVDVISTLITQFQQPTLAFLIAGMMLAAMGSKFEIPEPVYKFIVILLLLKVGMGAGTSVRNVQFVELFVPAVGAVTVGIGIVFLGRWSLLRWRGISEVDGLATVGLFGAVSASTLAASMAILDDGGIVYEGFIGALYPFMDIAALITAILLAKVSAARRALVATDGTVAMGGGTDRNNDVTRDLLKSIFVDTLRSPAISALLAGLALGLLARPETVYDSFYEPLFRGLLSILMLIMGMEAWLRFAELRKVAHAYILYGLTAPIVHGLLGFGAGMIAHEFTGFSAGGVVLMAVMASSSSDISGPPTMRAALPEANPSAYVGTSTGIGTPIAILSIPFYIALAQAFID